MHFVLVHDICFGGWCWYKLVNLLHSSGHTVEAVDLAASGVHPLRFNELRNIDDYGKPLMDLMASLAAGEKVVLVGHGFGGAIVALAVEMFPEKVSTAIFVAAFMPTTIIPLSNLIEQYRRYHPNDFYLNSDMKNNFDSNSVPSIKYGLKFMATKLFRRCSPKDLILSRSLVKEGSWFTVSLFSKVLSPERYGSANKVFIRCSEDLWINSDFETMMFQGCPGTEVKVLRGADHMPMLCRPLEFCIMLLQCVGFIVDPTAMPLVPV